MTPAHFDAWLTAASPRKPLLMGVLNVTPDSFSDGGKFTSTDTALAHAREMAASGADVIDIGGESTRPGSLPVDSHEQIHRIIPVIRAIASQVGGVTISVDTTRCDVAQAAADAGATIINDVSAGRDDPAIFSFVAQRRLPIILMHIQGTPQTMQLKPFYVDVVKEVGDFLIERREAAIAAGIESSRILFDPGIGFGKADAHNLQLLRETRRLSELGSPLLVGASRKGFIGRITGETVVADRVFGTAAIVGWCAVNGAGILRVHDVNAMCKVLKMVRAVYDSSEL